MNIIYKIALIFSIIGCINWGLVGIFNFNIVEYLLGDSSLITRIVYSLVALSGLLTIGLLPHNLD